VTPQKKEVTIEIGTVYTVSSIARHTGLSEGYLRNSTSSLRKFIAAFPQLSPDGKGLNDEGLYLYDEYLQYCSSLDSNGKRRQPEMTFEEFKEYAMDEYGINNSDAINEENSSELSKIESSELVEVEVMPVSSLFDNMDDALEQVGNILAAKVGHSIKTKITSKIVQEVNTQFAEINQLVEKFTK
jgi:hypothetical protein